MNMFVGVAFLLSHNFFGCGDLSHCVRRRIFFVFAMEKLVEVMHCWDHIKVVLFWWVACHPFKAACIPWIKRRLRRIARSDHDVYQEQQDADGQNKRSD